MSKKVSALRSPHVPSSQKTTQAPVFPRTHARPRLRTNHGHGIGVDKTPFFMTRYEAPSLMEYGKMLSARLVHLVFAGLSVLALSCCHVWGRNNMLWIEVVSISSDEWTARMPCAHVTAAAWASNFAYHMNLAFGTSDREVARAIAWAHTALFGVVTSMLAFRGFLILECVLPAAVVMAWPPLFLAWQWWQGPAAVARFVATGACILGSAYVHSWRSSMFLAVCAGLPGCVPIPQCKTACYVKPGLRVLSLMGSVCLLLSGGDALCWMLCAVLQTVRIFATRHPNEGHIMPTVDGALIMLVTLGVWMQTSQRSKTVWTVRQE